VIEGPATIFISGFFVSLGIFNPVLTLLTVLSADLVSDVVYYAAGRFWFNSASGKMLNFFRISSKNFSKFKLVFLKHKGKIMFFGKLSSFVGSLVMYVAGLTKIPFGEFITINAFGATFKSLLLLFAGYFVGGALIKLGRSLDLYTSIGLLLLSVILFLIYWGITSFSNKYITKTENIRPHR